MAYAPADHSLTHPASGLELGLCVHAFEIEALALQTEKPSCRLRAGERGWRYT